MSRTPLVLLPGTLLDAELFGHQIAHLADVAEITVGDLANDDSVAGMARTVLAAALPRFALAGLSLGGIVALEIMRRAPERVLRLALLDTNPLPPRPEQLAAWAELGGLAEAGRLDQVVDRLLPGLLRPGWHADERTERAVPRWPTVSGRRPMGGNCAPWPVGRTAGRLWEPLFAPPWCLWRGRMR